MKKRLFYWCIGGFAFTAISGTLLHYLYELTGQSLLAAPFSAVNESTWEHMKLLFFPLFAFALIQSRFFKDLKCFWCVKLCGTVFGLTLIPVLFYTLNGIFGKTPDIVNISLFFVSAALCFGTEAFLFKKHCLACKGKAYAIAALCAISALFVLFTFMPPHIPLFKDPITGGYGIIS